jgi:hypothetical protein
MQYGSGSHIAYAMIVFGEDGWGMSSVGRGAIG